MLHQCNIRIIWHFEHRKCNIVACICIIPYSLFLWANLFLKHQSTQIFKHKNKDMKFRLLWQSAIIAALGGFLFGFDIAVVSGTTAGLEKLFSLSQFELGFTVAIALIGTIIGTMIIGKPADKYGRRKTLQALAFIFLLGALGSSISINWGMFLFFRFLQGLVVGGISVVVPMYIAEISPAQMRGRLVILNQLNVVTAILSAYLSNYFIVNAIENNAWRWMLGVEIIPAAAFLLLLAKIPSSPRWLIMKGKLNEAIAEFKLLGFDNPEAEAKSIELNLSKTGESKKQKLFSKENSFPVMATILIAMFNQLAGINAIIYYAPRIFEMTGLGSNTAMLQSISIGGTNLLFTLLASFLIDRYGRRTLLMVGSVGMVTFLSLIAYAFHRNAFDGYSVMVYLIGYIAFFALSQGAVLWVFISEIFPNSVRSQGQALGSFTHWVMAAAVSWSFPVVTSALGAGLTFSFFALMMTLHFFFAWKVIPETKGKSLEQIQLEISGRRAVA
jgi:sugar porter (SP) family MFS transporter